MSIPLSAVGGTDSLELPQKKKKLKKSRAHTQRAEAATMILLQAELTEKGKKSSNRFIR
jgi:hypothetical protein